MILRSLKLENIRSYASEHIKFPEGSLMLSGDIGSGKSTILLAAEFALFGLRSDLRGESLLRHGKNEGSVELGLKLRGKEIIIRRSLKRKGSSVQQDTGHMIINGVRKDLTAVELKTRTLSLLGYPKELVSKSKSLLFRYTVYTPQEQMKQILFDDKSERLNTLRKVFGIDKYSRITENASIITRQIKLKARELAGTIHDLEEKKSSLSEKKEELFRSEGEARKILPLFQKAREQSSRLREEVEAAEKEARQLSELKSELNLNNSRIKEKSEAYNSNSKELDSLKKQVKELESPLAGEKIVKPDLQRRESLEKEKEGLEKSVNDLHLRAGELEIRKKNSAEVIGKISELSTCPTCLQEVPEDYREKVISREKESERKAEEEAARLKKEAAEKQETLKKAKEEIDRLAEQEKKYERMKMQAEYNQKLLREKSERIKSLNEMQESIKREIASLNQKNLDLNSRIKELSESEKKYQENKKLFDQAREKERELELKKVSLEKDAEGIRKTIDSLEKEIAGKEKSKKRIGELKELQEWIESSFINLMVDIERNVMARIHREFDGFFQQWFRTMIEDETISVSLDHDFTPIVQQDGYETSVEHLSGGEKTATALAYRLSLNKAINDVVGTIMTKDVIILDEPTDGFSSEQLDKVREVIEQLDMEQVIIVSHEPKVEGFVDSILKVEKSGHVSRVSA